MAAPARIVVAEDCGLTRSGLLALASAIDAVEVVGVAEDLPSLMDAVSRTNPDVVVTDVRMPPGGHDEGVQAAITLSATTPDVGVVVLSQHRDAGLAERLFSGGARGRAYVVKEGIAEPGALARVIDEVRAGRVVIDPAIVAGMLEDRATGVERLTPRERDVLALMARGRSNSAIAAQLDISRSAVEKNIGSIFQRLGLADDDGLSPRVAAVLAWIDAEGTDARA